MFLYGNRIIEKFGRRRKELKEQFHLRQFIEPFDATPLHFRQLNTLPPILKKMEITQHIKENTFFVLYYWDDENSD